MDNNYILISTDFNDAGETALTGLFSGVYRLARAGYQVLVNIPDHPLKSQLLREGAAEGKTSEIFTYQIRIGDHVEIQTETKSATLNSFAECVDHIILPARTATFKRKTSETDIEVHLNLDGSGATNISTGLGFFDHMLDQIGKHGGLDLDIRCEGDLQIDEHHTIEDVAISLGSALDEALATKKGIQRYDFVLPMDESQAAISLDLSGRPYLVFDAQFEREKVGDFPTEMVEHFFHSLVVALKATLHIKVEGKNDHHKIEAIFKGFARVLGRAVQRNEDHLSRIPSSKGAL